MRIMIGEHRLEMVSGHGALLVLTVEMKPCGRAKDNLDDVCEGDKSDERHDQ